MTDRSPAPGRGHPRLRDVMTSRVLRRLPRPTTGYRVSRELIPMRDGVPLLADHYQPTGEVSGTLLVRCPYGRGFPFSTVFARLYAARGYRVILQSVRGTFGSGGVFEPMVNEADDAADTVAWLRLQPWFTGRFGTVGLSYLGFTQWALLADPPPELAAAVVTVGPHDLHDSTWGTGSFSLYDLLGWTYLMAHQQDRPRVRAAFKQLTARGKVKRAAAGLPLGSAGRELLGDRCPWYEPWVAHPDADAPFWERLRYPTALTQTKVPVLLLGGWQDLFLDQTLTQFRTLRDHGAEVALTVGPWTHNEMLTGGLTTVTSESLDWLSTHLTGADGPARSSRVRVYVTGANTWRAMPDWPPTTTDRSWWLQPDARLGDHAISADASDSVSFTYDPAAPTPTVGGRLLAPGGGYQRDNALSERGDVVTFTSAPLTQDFEVFGCPVVELAHRSDNPHVDVFVRVSQVDARGRSRNVSDGYLRLPAGSGTVRVELDEIAHRFTVGSRIRLLIAGGCHPRFARNLGTGQPAITGTDLKPATHTVRLAGSRVVMPLNG